MFINDFDDFELTLLVVYLNHRYNEPPVDCLPLFLIPWQGPMSMNMGKLDEKFGRQARQRLREWFNVDDGNHLNERVSLLTLKEDPQFKLYHFLKEKGVLDQLRRDLIDGWLPSWVETAERTIALRSQLKAAPGLEGRVPSAD
jgi:hypothetical protein